MTAMAREVANGKRGTFWYVLTFGSVTAACVVWWFVGPKVLPDTALRSSVGEMFGPLTTLFSGLAFGGVILTIWLQSDELRLQRQEMEDTRQVLSEQQRQLEQQAISMKRQTFETTFFNLLRLIRDCAGTLPQNNAFVDVALNIRQRPVIAQGLLLVRFDQVWGAYGIQLGPYLRTLAIALSFAERADSDVPFYMSLLISQMTVDEQVVLACAVQAGRIPAPISDRVHRYRFFENLTKENFAERIGDFMVDWITSEGHPKPAPIG